ncbi:hypothetical protein LTR84_001151 [Exophiala bonariae]|uniref:Xylanolytic transcriptional activator regulatory domain-containing protein n=1 Tax=Exophiala bonariae TaxID=1690606 RepID=A0AAV9NWM4_9EURO|nr:hypothetical protein LTR84_001151 [Exophiala bonariae]
MPERSNSSIRGAGNFGSYQCQACLDANRECDLGTFPITVDEDFQSQTQPPQRAKGKARRPDTGNPDQQTYPILSEMSPAHLSEHHDHSTQNGASSLPSAGGQVPFSPQSKSTSPQEGSEMLLVRLTETPQGENGTRHPVEMTDRVLYFGDESIWSDSLRRARSSKFRYAASPQSLSTRAVDRNIHYAVPPTVRDQPQNTAQDDLDIQQEEMKLLQRKGAFSLPPSDVQRKLLDTYFMWIYPLQPILDKEQFLEEFERGQAPIILLQALLFAATTCCDESIIIPLWPSRRTAQSTLYKRVRALYDADHEQNHVTVIQVLYLMCFWWGSPMDKKDFSHWLAASIHLAQVTGMHRSYGQDQRLPSVAQGQKTLETHLVRDRFDAASVGRPMIINDDDCDIEPLCLVDFECDENGTPPQGAGHCVEMTKLATLNPKRAIDDDLSAWEKQLPAPLRYHEGALDPQAMLFAAMLSFGLHFCRIVLHRKGFLDANTKNESLSTALASANVVTRLVEELLSEGLLPRAQVHLIAVIFASFTILVVSMEQGQGARRRVLQHKSKLCLLALAEFRDYWPFVDWMYRMFSNLLHWLEVGDHPSASSSSEGNNQTLWTTQLRPNHIQLPSQQQQQPPDLTDSAVEVAHDDNAATSMPLYEQDASSMADVQPEYGMLQQFMSGMLTSENFLDPFMPLDSLEWDDPSITNLANLPGNSMLWTSTPLPMVDKGSLS